MSTETRRAWGRAAARAGLSGLGVVLFTVFVFWSWQTKVRPCGGELIPVNASSDWASWPLMTARGVEPYTLSGRDLGFRDMDGGYRDVALHDPALCPRSGVALDLRGMASGEEGGRSTTDLRLRHDPASGTFAVVAPGPTADGVLVAAFRRLVAPRQDFETDVAARIFWGHVIGLVAAAGALGAAARRLRTGWDAGSRAEGEGARWDAMKSAGQCAKAALVPLWVLAATIGVVAMGELAFALATGDWSDM